MHSIAASAMERSFSLIFGCSSWLCELPPWPRKDSACPCLACASHGRPLNGLSSDKLVYGEGSRFGCAAFHHLPRYQGESRWAIFVKSIHERIANRLDPASSPPQTELRVLRLLFILMIMLCCYMYHVVKTDHACELFKRIRKEVTEFWTRASGRTCDEADTKAQFPAQEPVSVGVPAE